MDSRFAYEIGEVSGLILGALLLLKPSIALPASLGLFFDWGL